MKITSGPSDLRLLLELEPTVSDLMNRHLSTAREWFPHQYVPWGRGRDFDGPLGGEAWREEQSALSPTARAALVVNLLTEDNLPGYHHTLAAQTSRDGAWGAWLHRWTAEEDRHATAIRGYLHATRAVDPIALERARMAHLGAGVDFGGSGVLQTVAYVAVQELATRVSHRNTGRLSGDPVCDRLLARIAQDENLHMVFYRELLRAALDLVPDETLAVLDGTVRAFRMPGHSMPGFAALAAELAVAGVYDPRIHHDEVLVPLLRSLRIFDLTGLGPRGEQARESLAAQLGQLDTRAARFVERRARTLATRAEQAAGIPQPSPIPSGES